jgi:hypothetical protein
LGDLFRVIFGWGFPSAKKKFGSFKSPGQAAPIIDAAIAHGSLQTTGLLCSA